MKKIIDYIKENLDVDNFEYKFNVWFESDKQHYKPMLDLLKDCYDRRLVQKDDIEKFLATYNTFKIKKFVDFFDEDVKRDEAISVDYIYLFTKIIEHFINNFILANKLQYQWQALHNGQPNVEVDTAPLSDNDKDKKEED